MTATMTVDVETVDVETVDAETGTPAPRRRRHAVVACELGELRVVADGDALVGVYFPEHRPAPPASTFGELVDPIETDDETLIEAAAQLVDYVAGRRAGFDLAYVPDGSERAQQVWALIAAVPRGETTTYAALGRAVGVGPRSAGQFVARNPLSVVVPCHRVVASDGRLTGYAGGVDRKRRLLELEGALAVGAGKVPRRPASAPDEAPSGMAPSGVAPSDATVDHEGAEVVG